MNQIVPSSDPNWQSSVWNTLLGLGFKEDEISQAIEHSDYAIQAPGLFPGRPHLPQRIFHHLDESEAPEDGDGGDWLEPSADEYQVVFIVPPDFGTTTILAKNVTDSLIVMQEYLSRNPDSYSYHLHRWNVIGNPSRIYEAMSMDHMFSLREQVDIVHLPVVTLPEPSQLTNECYPSQSSSSPFINVICVFGPATKLNRLVRPLKMIK